MERACPRGARDSITELHYVDPHHDNQLVDHLLSIRDNTICENGPTGLIRRPANAKRPMGITPDDWRSTTPSVRETLHREAEKRPDVRAAALPRGGNAPEDVKVWIRHDSNARALGTTLTEGPQWSTVVRRITKDANMHAVIADETVNGNEPVYHIRWSEPVPGGATQYHN